MLLSAFITKHVHARHPVVIYTRKTMNTTIAVWNAVFTSAAVITTRSQLLRRFVNYRTYLPDPVGSTIRTNPGSSRTPAIHAVIGERKRDKMLRRHLGLALFLLMGNCACGQWVAHPAPADVVKWGGAEFHVDQYPLEPKIREFEAANRLLLYKGDTANRRGYVAKWSILRNALWLRSVKGELVSEKISLVEAIGEDSLPCKASWFTGDIQLPVGEFDFDNHAWPFAVRLRFVNGELKSSDIVRNATDTGTGPGVLEIKKFTNKN